MEAYVADTEADVAATHVGVLAHMVGHEQRLGVDEVVLPGQFGVAEAVPLTREAELALRVPLRALEQLRGEPTPVEGAHRPLLDDSRPGAVAR